MRARSAGANAGLCCSVSGGIHDLQDPCWVGDAKNPGPGATTGPPVENTTVASFDGSCIKTKDVGCFRMTLGGRSVRVVNTDGTPKAPLEPAVTGSDLRVCADEERKGLGTLFGSPRCP